MAWKQLLQTVHHVHCITNPVSVYLIQMNIIQILHHITTFLREID